MQRLDALKSCWRILLLPALTLMACPEAILAKQSHGGRQITLIQMGDLHATLAPHAAVLRNPDGTERYSDDAGGLAKLKTVVDRIRRDNPESLLLSCGDLTHGSAEALFTVGDAMMPAMNAFGIDVYTPGNWDFGYGPAVFRHRFATRPPFPPLPANIRVMADAFDGEGVSRAAFPTVALNVYNDAPLPDAFQGQRVLDPYKLFEVDGVRVAVIGITAAIVPQQADTFNIGLRFTQGVEELPEIIHEVEAQGAHIIVVQSELGLAQNIEIARRFSDIDVMYSAHTHEVTLGALIADRHGVIATTPGGPLSGHEVARLARGGAIVVETNRDMYVGRLDLQIAGGKVVNFQWEAIPVDETVPSDPEMEVLVARAEEDFIAGKDGEVKRHSFLPGGFCPFDDCGDTTQRGLQLTVDLDTTVGRTDTLLLRHHVLEDVLNNFIADAIRDTTDTIVAGSGPDGWTGVDISMTNGFRFGSAVLPGQAITLRDLYTWFPVAPAIVVAEFTGQAIEKSLNDILAAVFDRNPFLQRGGWYLGLSNMTQKLDLDNRPFNSSGGRIVETTVGNEPIDPSRRYVFASCYGHGDPIDQVCRTGGGSGHLFFELANADDPNGPVSLVPPVNDEQIIQGTTVKQVAPDRFLHPVHILQRYLAETGEVTESEFGPGRVSTVDSTQADNPPIPPPVSEPDPSFVQPPQGAGPVFFSGRTAP